ncbi:hypothetical protein DPEC_G00086950 [Dallia pectoralis]|uniref:Uncharacterized protein n=1 Tax=Dallia pectoralis TaxID=75939 RepID=A0ACC2GZV4_DALPE|nr:hypothetical protein DPEC_G00086950 [Dallia pectoralis]
MAGLDHSANREGLAVLGLYSKPAGQHRSLIKPKHDSEDFSGQIKQLEQLLDSDHFFRKDFAVVLQPFLKHADPPRLPSGKVDMSFFTHDCFHFTIKGHEELAKGLWNNMFQPQGEKFMVSSFSDPIHLICPPMDHPYIYTRPSAAKKDESTVPGVPNTTAPRRTALLLTPRMVLGGLLAWGIAALTSV